MKKTKTALHKLIGENIVCTGTGYYATHIVTLLDITPKGEMVIREQGSDDSVILPNEFSNNKWVTLSSLIFSGKKVGLSKFEGRRIYRTRTMKDQNQEKGERYLFPETVKLISATDTHMIIQEGKEFKPGCTKILDQSWIHTQVWKEAN